MLHPRFSQHTSLFRGFTLVEIIVVVSVLGIMAGVITVGAVSARRTYAVRDASEQLADYLRESISLTQNGIKVGTSCSVDGDSEAPQCSWYTVEAVSGSSTYTQGVVGDDSHSVSRTLPAGTQFNLDTEAEFAYCPPLLYVATDQTDFEDPDPSIGYYPASDVCGDLRGTIQERSFGIVHSVNATINACVRVKTPGIVTVTMETCT